VNRTAILAATAAMLFHATPVHAEQVSLERDLKATIALQGMPCDELVDAKRNGDSDYTAVCKDGNRYHVFVDAQGRVVAKKL
jgi:hypothetical protein